MADLDALAQLQAANPDMFAADYTQEDFDDESRPGMLLLFRCNVLGAEFPVSAATVCGAYRNASCTTSSMLWQTKCMACCPDVRTTYTRHLFLLVKRLKTLREKEKVPRGPRETKPRKPKEPKTQEAPKMVSGFYSGATESEPVAELVLPELEASDDEVTSLSSLPIPDLMKSAVL